MSDERLLIPQDPTYFEAMGLATVAFARLEWDAVWCCERLEPGYLNTIEVKKKTAGTIADDLKRFFAQVPDAALRNKLAPMANEFADVVLERNGLLHGKPGTGPSGEQRLFRGGKVWTTGDVEAFADRCVRASSPLNDLLYKELAHPPGQGSP